MHKSFKTILAILLISIPALSFAQDDPVVAKVLGKPITLSQTQEFYKNIPNKQASFQQLYPRIREAIIEQQLVLKSSESVDTEDARVKLMIEDAIKRVKMDVWLNNERLKRLNDKDVVAFYENWKAQQPKIDEVEASHILLETEAQAKAVIVAINAGKDFAEMAKEKSIGPSGQNGGYLGFFSKGKMVKPFEDAVFAMQDGKISKAPIKSQFGFHIIKKLSSRVQPIVSLDKIRPQVEQQVLQGYTQDIIKDLFKENESNIERFELPK